MGKIAYNNPQMLYYYKNLVGTPPLQMVDDVLTIQKCSDKSLRAFCQHPWMTPGLIQGSSKVNPARPQGQPWGQPGLTLLNPRVDPEGQ